MASTSTSRCATSASPPGAGSSFELGWRALSRPRTCEVAWEKREGGDWLRQG